jgi:hypothetical protein
MLISPILLFLTMYGLFQLLTTAFGYPLGWIRWRSISHDVHDALGLGGFAYTAWLT